MKTIDWALLGVGVLLSLACASGGKEYKPHTVAVAMDTEEGRTCLRECQRDRNHCTSLCDFGNNANNDKFFCTNKCDQHYEECKLTCPDACYQDDDPCNKALDARIEARKKASNPNAPQPAQRYPMKPQPAGGTTHPASGNGAQDVDTSPTPPPL